MREGGGGGSLDSSNILPAGDAAFTIDLGNRIDLEVNRRVHALAARIGSDLASIAEVEIIPGYANLLVRYDPRAVTYDEMLRVLQRIEIPHEQDGIAIRRFVIPAAYGGSFGPDLEEVARIHDMQPEEVVRLHVERDYPIFCLGFSPGFPFLGGLPEALHTPRLETPRPRVPIGSVAIGGSQTGVYPTSTPGGWRLIGRTPSVLFDVTAPVPVPYRPGDLIRFAPITAEEYERMRLNPQPLEAETLPVSTAGA